MNLREYKQKKLPLSFSGDLTTQNKTVPANQRVCCWKCYRPQKNCLCFLIQPFDTKTRFLFLMHPLEAKKEKMGTGRICLATLKNSKLFVGVDFNQCEDLRAEILNPHYFTVLLYPGENSWNLSLKPSSELSPKRPLQIIILDGTWPCVKKMMRLNLWLQALPRVSFTPGRRSLFSIKQQPDDLCLSSLEAIHQVLDEMSKNGDEEIFIGHDNLMIVFKEMIQFQINCANDPTLPSYRKSNGFRSPDKRKPSAKWEKRNIFFKDLYRS